MKSVGFFASPSMPPTDRVLPRSRRAADPRLRARRVSGIAAAPAPRPVAVPRGPGLAGDIRAMAVVARMLRRGAERWLQAIAGSP
jgi:hypothetical protein